MMVPGSLVVFFLLTFLAGAQDAGPTVTVSAGQGPVETIRLQVGQSAVIKTPWKVKQVAVTDPDIADVDVYAVTQGLPPDQVRVMGKATGMTDVTVWSESGETWQARVEVDVDIARITQDIQTLFPGSRLEVTRTRDVIIIRGLLGRVEHAEQLRRYLEAVKVKFVDMTSVAGIQQVQIQVKLAEVSRTAIRAMGINGFHTGDHFFGASQVGSSGGGALQSVSMAPASGASAVTPIPAREGGAGLPFLFNNEISVNPLVTLFGGFPDVNLEVFIQALAENQYLRILAEPNLVALSGEEASFLAGGEYPIPVVQGNTTGSTSITIQYKEFGVRLRFRPTVLGDGAIRLLVAPEVSDLSDVGAVTLQGFSVPSLLTRRAETTLEMHSGQTFAMAGLLNRTDSATSSRVPFLSAIPIIGALFRSVRYEAGDTELVVLVTASLVEPLSVAQVPPVPGDTHTAPNDWELYGLGRIVGKGNTKPLPPLPPALDLGLEKLRGPGAWADYDRPGSRSAANMTPQTAPHGEGR
jgi:pilus assembly protein CpaC